MTRYPLLTSKHYALVDHLRTDSVSAASQAVAVVGFALLTAVGAQVRVFLWEVPFTLQTLAVYGSGLYLGWRNGMLSQLLYLTIGMFFPVFAGDGSGIQYFAGSVTAGYLLAYPVTAAVVGWLSRSWNSPLGATVCLIIGSAILFASGVVWLHFAADHSTWWISLDRGWLRFVPADLTKILAVSALYAGSRVVGSGRPA